jgi:hypothetical protein
MTALALLVLLAGCQGKPEAAKTTEPQPTRQSKDGASPEDKATAPQDSEAVLQGSPQKEEPAAPAPEATEAPEVAPAPAGAPVMLDPTKRLTEEQIREGIRQYSPVRLEYDESSLTDNDKLLIRKLVQASNAIDRIFWKQVSAEGTGLRELVAAEDSPESRTLLHFLLINYGPWDRLRDDAPFIGEKPKPLGAGFYPEDLTKEEFNAWLKKNPKDAEAFRSGFTVIRRNPDGSLLALPYPQAYPDELTTAARFLKEAAALAPEDSLKAYLLARANSLLSNDYYSSDLAWMDLNAKVEITIGPYEVYEDKLFGYKTAFESFVTLRDAEASKLLKTFEEWAPRLEETLPGGHGAKTARGTESPIVVADLIFSAGDTRAGVQTIAFNLPNDERVREARGSKKVLLRNVMYAKFDKILTAVAARTIDPGLAQYLNRDAFFNHTLMHEISHGIGPGTIKGADGKDTTVSQALAELYPHIEEAKADVLGLYNNLMLIEKSVEVLKRADGQPMTVEEATQCSVATFTAGLFRSLRFGAQEAHGKSNLMQLNYLVEKEALRFDQPSGRYNADFAKMPGAIKAMAAELLNLQAAGDYKGAAAFLEKYGKVAPETQQVLDRLKNLPVDIEPIYKVPKV